MCKVWYLRIRITKRLHKKRTQKVDTKIGHKKIIQTDDTKRGPSVSSHQSL